MQAPISLSAKTSGRGRASSNIVHSNPRYSSRPQNEPVPIQQAAAMNPELLALLAETGITAAADTLFWDLSLPLPIKKSSFIASATYAIRTGELTITSARATKRPTQTSPSQPSSPSAAPTARAAFTTATFAAQNRALN
jgi:hypothetical protein